MQSRHLRYRAHLIDRGRVCRCKEKHIGIGVENHEQQSKQRKRVGQDDNGEALDTMHKSGSILDRWDRLVAGLGLGDCALRRDLVDVLVLGLRVHVRLIRLELSLHDLFKISRLKLQRVLRCWLRLISEVHDWSYLLKLSYLERATSQ